MELSAFTGRPDYRVDILARRNRVTVSVGEEVVADSQRCLLVDEQDHGLVFYFPPGDVRLDRFVPDQRTSVCPFKGVATYRRYPHGEGDVLVWSYEEPFPEVARLAGYVAFVQDAVNLRVGVATPPVSGAVTPAPPPSTLEIMLEVFDVTPVGEHHYRGTSDGGSRRVVDGSQVLAQAIVATAVSVPRHSVRTAHAVFVRAVDDERELEFDVDVLHEGRTFASAVVTVAQGGRRCATVTVLADVVQADVIAHHHAMPAVGEPTEAVPCAMPLVGRELRLVGIDDPNDPDETGPPVIDAWLRYDIIPERADLAKALIAHFTGHLSISTSMRSHPGVGTAMAHDSLSAGVMGIAVTFHEPVAWEGWLLYHHESTQAGAGMSYVRGQVFTEQGALIASFTQDGMIRAFAEAVGRSARPGSFPTLSGVVPTYA